MDIFPKGFKVLKDYEAEKMDMIIHVLQKHFFFLKHIYFPCVTYKKNIYSDFLSHHELFLLQVDEELILCPEYTNMYVKTMPEENIYYLQPCFRYERPQRGRKRQFYQFGVEILYSYTVLELCMYTLKNVLDELQLKYTLVYNNMGTIQDRSLFFDYIKNNLHQLSNLCTKCMIRIELVSGIDISKAKNSLFSLIECNCSNISEIYKPFISSDVSHILGNFTDKHMIRSNNLFRGIDYYHGFIFEIILEDLIVGGGGMYNDGKNFGFALGLDRLLLFLDSKSHIRLFIMPNMRHKTKDILNIFYLNNIKLNLINRISKKNNENQTIICCNENKFVFFDDITRVFSSIEELIKYLCIKKK